MLAFLLGISVSISSGQTRQLENDFRNTFSADDPIVDPNNNALGPATLHQRSSGTAYGGWQTTRIKDSDGNVLAGSTSELPGSVTVKRPSDGGSSGRGRQLVSVKMSRPMVLRLATTRLGSVLARPSEDLLGVEIPDPEGFFLPEPWNSVSGRMVGTTSIDKGRFYYSPHAEQVFATESGNISVYWKLRVPPNLADDNAAENFQKQTLNISGSPVKAPRKMFWTEGNFSGPPVAVPEDRVKEVNVIYPPAFPAEVAEVDSVDYDPDAALPPERRTLWYDGFGRSIHAYNLEGRVFVELLGNLKEPDRLFREHLGFEIIDVLQEVRPTELHVAIGEAVLPSTSTLDQTLGADPPRSLQPSIIAGGLGTEADPFLFEHVSGGGTQNTLYAVRETTPLRLFDIDGDGSIDEQQSNEVLVYWLESGVMNLFWPIEYSGYIFKWPEDFLEGELTLEELAEFYAIYARPESDAEADRLATGVQLNSSDNPDLVYQDDPTRQHAQITPLNVFHTGVSAVDPDGRALIRYTRGEAIWFERVYSQRNTEYEFYGDAPIDVAIGDRIRPVVAQPVSVPVESRTLILDVGNAQGSYAGSESPAHALEGIPADAVGWNTVAGDVAGGLTFADGGAATGVSIDFGAQTGGSGPIVWESTDWSDSFSPNVDASSGILDGALMTDFIWAQQPSNLGARITGLPPGRYRVYVTYTYPEAIDIAIGVDTDDVTTFDSDEDASQPNFDFGVHQIKGPENTQWAEGRNYAVQEIETHSSDEYVVVIADPQTWVSMIPGIMVVPVDPTGRGDSELASAQSEEEHGLTGYIRQTSGTAFNPEAYIDPITSGFTEAANGSIIGVNNLAGNDELEVWWFEANQPPAEGNFTSNLWPRYVQKYKLSWPIADPNNDAHDVIVMARNDGSGELGVASSGTIYRQDNAMLPGYNPNEEHALLSGGVAWALRDDLNGPQSSEPWVLLDYTDPNDSRPAMRVFKVVQENAAHTFNYDGNVGAPLQAPMPLPSISLPIKADGNVANFEVEPATVEDAPAFDTGVELDRAHYDKFTYEDRKGGHWIYRGVHDPTDPANTSDKSFDMRYFYKTQGTFDFPGLITPPEGTIIPYLSQGTISNPIANVTPKDITFIPRWPSAPVLNIAESLTLPKHGLPAVRGQTSAKVLYEQSVANDATAALRSVKLFDPTRAKTFELSDDGLDAVPDAVVKSNFLGKTYFPQLPPHLSQRIFLDPNIGAMGALVFIGEFKDEIFGEDYLLLNVFSTEDVDVVKALCLPEANDPRKGKWDAAVAGLATTMETHVEDTVRRGHYEHDQDLDVTIGVTALAEVTHDDTAVDSYALSASGGGTGFVVLAVGDGEAFTPSAEPVSLEVFRVAAPLYRGELKALESANPLDEKLTMRHSGDFAGDPSDFEFAWIKGQPVDGKPPELYTFDRTLVLGDLPANWQILHNPPATYAEFRSPEADLPDLPSEQPIAPWANTGNLANSGIVINDGEGVEELHGTTLPYALLRREFTQATPLPFQLFLSTDIARNDGAIIYINHAEVAVWNVPGRDDSFEVDDPSFDNFDPLDLVFSVAPESLLEGRNTMTVELYTQADASTRTDFNVRLEGLTGVVSLSDWQDITSGAKSGSGEEGKVRHTIEGATIETLTDNYLTMRYRPKTGSAAAQALIDSGRATPAEWWSAWMTPQLAEGWIKRVLAGINPFDQRVTDLFNNAINTDVSLLTQTGTRFEGNVALNLENIDNFGLAEIYETVLRRGKELSIDGNPPLNVPAANDALLLAAGYLNDLYVILGDEAFADAANPTIAFDTDSGDFGEFNTALYAFNGQLDSVLEEELALLRGRDDFLQPDIIAPIYNRLVWNYTRGIDAGEAIYALNYNIQDIDGDGAANAADAATQYPQGHGDAYGHYLTALKVYYGLLSDEQFAWAPRIEAVTVLGQPVAVDYQDERKFATAAAKLARTASQTLDLTYRKEFTSDQTQGWEHLSEERANARTTRTRQWGTDHWASRGGQGAFFHWVTGNSVLPEEDPNPDHEGIQEVERGTVPELDDIVAEARAIQQTLDNVDARLNPLGLARGALSFDISPSEVDAGKTHFEQVKDRAIAALGNAVFGFNNAKDSTRFLRRQEASLDERRAAINAQERAFDNELIELYGTPYPDDIGPGKTYAQGYEGPDLLHYQIVDTPELFRNPTGPIQEFQLLLDPGFTDNNSAILNFDLDRDGKIDTDNDGNPLVPTVSYSLSEWREVMKKDTWTGRRAFPGKLQTAISNALSSRQAVRVALEAYDQTAGEMGGLIDLYVSALRARNDNVRSIDAFNEQGTALEASILTANIVEAAAENLSDEVKFLAESLAEAFPTVAGALGVDATSGARSAAKGVGAAAEVVANVAVVDAIAVAGGLELALSTLERDLEEDLEDDAWRHENEQLLADLSNALSEFISKKNAIDVALRDLDQANRDYRAAESSGFALQRERETFRKRGSAIIQGFRTRDLAFRVFRDEALEKYKVLFDLASRYAFLAARAYDYETGLLNSSGSSAASAFFDGIVQSRALGVIDSDGQPQFSASDTGDPGLAGVLAQMETDWSVVKSRLGFNNPDRYRTTFSLREENYRIVPGEEGDQAWSDKLAECEMANVLDDPDVRRYALQIAEADGLPVPGLVIPFDTTITRGFNFFGQALAGGDHGFSPASFATKIRASGIAFDGYIGMDSPTAAGGALTNIGAQSPNAPGAGFLDSRSLSATPFVYLIPAGVDSMRSPPLGDVSTVRSWVVEDQAIPLPFNIGNTDFSTNNGFFSAESLSEPAFIFRKHQPFRAVPSGTVFSSAPGFTNSRLIGRSVWNSNWKIVIPGDTLRNDAEVGLEVFIATVRDIELFLETYSYSGN